jgi:Flp pilus assembly protein TadD
LRQPQQALTAFDAAMRTSPSGEQSAGSGAGFHALVATGRAKAWYQLGDVGRSTEFQEQAVRLAPDDPKLWSGLADLYQVQGRMPEAEQARLHAQQLQR